MSELTIDMFVDKLNDNHLVQKLRALGATGILTADDIPHLTSQRRRVLDFMIDGEWHTGPAIVEVAGGSEGLRRLRELREITGVEIKRRRVEGTRTFEYQLIKVSDTV